MVADGALLEVHHVSKTYVNALTGHRIHALDDVSLTVGRNDFVCLVGPSGCGKSTLLRIIAGLTPPTSGVVLLNGVPVKGPGADRGMVFQDYALFPWKTALENVAYGLEIKGLPRAERYARARHFLLMVGLAGFEDKYPRELSGGMKQRVAVARALANEPDVLLMDEPFAAVDALQRQHLQEELTRLWAETRSTIVFVTHSVDEAVFLAERVVVMAPRPGRIRSALPVAVPRPRNWLALQRDARFNELRNAVLELVLQGDEGAGVTPARQHEAV